jgi:hypothetical protein
MHKEKEETCHLECLNEKAGIVLELRISLLDMNVGGKDGVDNDRAKL